MSQIDFFSQRAKVIESQKKRDTVVLEARVFTMSRLPPEIMSMIWEYAIITAVAEAMEFFDNEAIRVVPTICERVEFAVSVTGPAGVLNHPLHQYFLISKATKQNIERVCHRLFPDGLDLRVYCCRCELEWARRLE